MKGNGNLGVKVHRFLTFFSLACTYQGHLFEEGFCPWSNKFKQKSQLCLRLDYTQLLIPLSSFLLSISQKLDWASKRMQFKASFFKFVCLDYMLMCSGPCRPTETEEPRPCCVSSVIHLTYPITWPKFSNWELNWTPAFSLLSAMNRTKNHMEWFQILMCYECISDLSTSLDHFRKYFSSHNY